jgi:hypothetical protein
LGVNDSNIAFNPSSDLLVEITGITFGGGLNANSYFI